MPHVQCQRYIRPQGGGRIHHEREEYQEVHNAASKGSPRRSAHQGNGHHMQQTPQNKSWNHTTSLQSGHLNYQPPK